VKQLTDEELFDSAPELGDADPAFEAAPEVAAPDSRTALDNAAAFARGAGQGGTAGFGDELSGLMGAGREAAARHPVLATIATTAAPLVNPALAIPAGFSQLGALTGIGQKPEFEGNDKLATIKAYLSSRNSDRASNAQADKESGGYYLAGNVAGALPTAGMSLGAGLARTMAGAGAQMAAAGAGGANELSDVPSEALKQGLVGATGVGLLHGAGKLLPTAKGLAQWAQRKAVGSIARSDTPAVDRLLKKGQLDEFGQWLLNNKVVKFGRNAENMAGDIEKQVELRGAQYDDAVKNLDEAGLRFSRKEVAGIPEAISRKIKTSDEGSTAARSALDTWKNSFEANNTLQGGMSLAELEAEKSALNNAFLDSITAKAPKAKQVALSDLRRGLMERAESGAQELQSNYGAGNRLADNFMSAKSELGNALTANEMLGKQLRRNIVNRDLSLTDNLAAMAGGNAERALSSSPAESGVKAAFYGYAHKQLRERGAASAADVANRLAKFAGNRSMTGTQFTSGLGALGSRVGASQQDMRDYEEAQQKAAASAFQNAQGVRQRR